MKELPPKVLVFRVLATVEDLPEVGVVLVSLATVEAFCLAAVSCAISSSIRVFTCPFILKRYMCSCRPKTPRLHPKATHQGYTPRLHPKATPQGYTPRLHTKATHQGYTPRLHTKATHQGYTPRLHMKYNHLNSQNAGITVNGFS